MSALREVLVRFGFQTDQAEARKASSTADGLTAKFNKIAGAVGAGLVFDKVRDFTSAVIDMGDEIGDTAEQIGISGKELQRWRYIAESSGASTQSLGVGFKILAKNANEAKDASSEQAKTFKALGVSVTDATGRLKDPAQLFREVGLGVASIENPAERTAMLLKVFGKSGAELGPIFTKGAAGIEAMSSKFDELGGGLGDDALGVLGDADQKLRDMDLASRKLKGTLAVALYPAFKRVTEGASDAIVTLEKAAGGTNLVEGAVTSLSVAAAAGAVAWAAPFLPFILTAGAAAASIADVTNAFTGGQSKMLDALGWIDEKLTGNNLAKQAGKEATKFANDPMGFIQEDNNNQNKADNETQLENLRQGYRTEYGGRERGDRIFDPNQKYTPGQAENWDVVGGQLMAIDKQAREIAIQRKRYLEGHRLEKGGVGSFVDNLKTGMLASDPTAQAAQRVRAEDRAPALAAAGLAGPMAGQALNDAITRARLGAAPTGVLGIGAPVAAAAGLGGAAPQINLNVRTTNSTTVTATGGDPEEIATGVAAAQSKSTAQSIEATKNAIIPVIAKPGG